MYDVAVIGGGPAGSRLAYQLADLGHSVVVLEKQTRLDRPVCCTGIVGQECLSRFNIDSRLIIRQASSARLFSPSGKLISLRRQQPQAAILDRPAFNAALAEQAQASGASYLLDSPVHRIEVLKDRVEIESGQPGKKSAVYEARVVTIASGAGSKLTGQLGLGKVGDFAVGAQAEVAAGEVDEVEVYLGRKIAPAFFAWLVPTHPGRALVGLLARKRAGFYLKKFISSLAAEGRVAADEVEPDFAPVPLRPLAKTYGRRLIIVGGAAGQAKPTTGGGIYYGMLCADIAADILHGCLESDNLTARNLSGYEKAWRRKLSRELRIGQWSRRFFELLSDRQIDRVFDVVRSNGIDKVLIESEELNFDWHGSAILRLIGHRALSRMIETVKPPFPSRRRGQTE